jgi:hypothetical protein
VDENRSEEGLGWESVWNGKGRLRSGLSEAVPECGLDRGF